jgi:hypothetical protein
MVSLTLDLKLTILQVCLQQLPDGGGIHNVSPEFALRRNTAWSRPDGAKNRPF